MTGGKPTGRWQDQQEPGSGVGEQWFYLQNTPCVQFLTASIVTTWARPPSVPTCIHYHNSPLTGPLLFLPLFP